jgi:hypothetical protein
MVSESLPQEVLHFLTYHVHSCDDFGVLVALIEDGGRWWSTKAMAAHTGIGAADVQRVLECFARENLLDIRISDDIRYCLRPGSLDLESGLHAFAAAYNRTPILVLRWVASLAPRSITDFAAAFRVRKP